MRQWMATLWHWFQQGRHVRALEQRECVVVEMESLHALAERMDNFYAWAYKSGALNDGVPRRTRKRVQREVSELLKLWPVRVR